MSFEHTVVVRGRKQRPEKIQELAARLAQSYDAKLVTQDEEEDGDDSDGYLELHVAFPRGGGTIEITSLLKGYRLHIDSQRDGNRDSWDDIGGLLNDLAAKLGSEVDEETAAAMIEESETEPETGAPILRPLVWEFPDDPMVTDLGDEAMLGPFVLAAPITQQGATSRQVYLPAGRWFELHSGRIFDGPTTIDASISTAALPLYVRAGAILPTTDSLEIYPGAAPSSFTLYEDDGSQLTEGARTTITVTPRSDGASVALDHDSATSARTLHVRVHRVDGMVSGVDGAQSFQVDPDDRSLVATATDATHLALAFHYDPAIAEPDPPVAVTFEIHVPAGTLQATPIAIVTSTDTWTQQTPLAWISAGVARGTVTLPRGEWFEYKVTRGSWETVEKQASCAEVANRSRFAAAGTQIETVATWRDRCGN
jgi:hypothetical protein